jgi:hypothetical protein
MPLTVDPRVRFSNLAKISPPAWNSHIENIKGRFKVLSVTGWKACPTLQSCANAKDLCAEAFALPRLARLGVELAS